jgi:hypothetical protein
MVISTSIALIVYIPYMCLVMRIPVISLNRILSSRRNHFQGFHKQFYIIDFQFEIDDLRCLVLSFLTYFKLAARWYRGSALPH